VADRINITIPSSLNERLQLVKGKMNVSRICQEAIEKAVSLEEINKADIPARDKLIQRLRKEKEETTLGWASTGFTDGKEDALELSYDDFKLLEQNSGISEDTRTWVIEKHFKYYDNPNEDYYFEGWRQGALSIWEEIKNEI
jgi:hypothetical protein